MKNILTLILFFVSISSHAQDFWTKVEKDLFKELQSPEFVNYVLDGHSLTGMPREVIREHLVELYKRRELSKFLVEEMRHAGFEKLEAEDMKAFGRKFGAELGTSLAMKGMTRLETKDQRIFISFLNTWLNHASAQDCKWMLTVGATSSASDQENIAMKYYGKFKREELRLYFRMLRKSMLAEINNFPYPKSINEDQMKIADDALQVKLERNFKQQSVRIETLEAMTDMNNSSAKDVCDGGKLIFSSILDMGGFAGDLVILKFIHSTR